MKRTTNLSLVAILTVEYFTPVTIVGHSGEYLGTRQKNLYFNPVTNGMPQDNPGSQDSKGFEFNYFAHRRGGD